MKFIILKKDFTTTDPNAPLFPVTIKKGTRFGKRKGNMFENGDHGYKGHFVRVHYFGAYQDLKIPYEYLTDNSVKTLKETAVTP